MTALAVVFRAGALAALPSEHVIETMRPLPCEPLAGAPTFVLGASVVRGRPVPVVDAATLIGAPREEARRWIALRVGDRSVALAVAEIVDVRPLPRASFSAEPPPLLRGAVNGAARALATLDGELLVVLEAGSLVPSDAWDALTRGGPS